MDPSRVLHDERSNCQTTSTIFPDAVARPQEPAPYEHLTCAYMFTASQIDTYDLGSSMSISTRTSAVFQPSQDCCATGDDIVAQATKVNAKSGFKLSTHGLQSYSQNFNALTIDSSAKTRGCNLLRTKVNNEAQGFVSSDSCSAFNRSEHQITSRSRCHKGRSKRAPSSSIAAHKELENRRSSRLSMDQNTTTSPEQPWVARSRRVRLPNSSPLDKSSLSNAPVGMDQEPPSPPLPTSMPATVKSRGAKVRAARKRKRNEDLDTTTSIHQSLSAPPIGKQDDSKSLGIVYATRDADHLNGWVPACQMRNPDGTMFAFSRSEDDDSLDACEESLLDIPHTAAVRMKHNKPNKKREAPAPKRHQVIKMSQASSKAHIDGIRLTKSGKPDKRVRNNLQPQCINEAEETTRHDVAGGTPTTVAALDCTESTKEESEIKQLMDLAARAIL